MPSELLKKFRTLIRPTISAGSITTLAGRTATRIDNTVTRADIGTVWWQVANGATAPAAGAPYKLFLHRWHGDATNDFAPDNIGTTDAALSAEPAYAECLGIIQATTVANAIFRLPFELRNLSPYYSLSVWNGSLQTWNATFDLIVIPHTFEGQ